MPPFLSSVKKSIQRKRKRDADVCSSDAKMDAANKALCFALRKSGTKLKDIRKVVKKTDGKRPSLSAISQAARSFNTEKKQRGRKLGKNKTTT